jgi:two-component system phosphate regulon sensor histidine kinase PhoR
LSLYLLLAVATAGYVAVSLAVARDARSVRQGVARAVAAVRRLARGEHHVFLPVERTGPVGELARAVNELGDQLRAMHLAATEQRVFDQALVRETPNGLLIVDASQRIRSANPAFARLVPIRGELIGAAVADAIGLPELLGVLAGTVRTRRPAELEVRANSRDLLLRALPLADGGSTLIVVLDVTSLHVAERARRDFFANVSHELRTPITALVGYAEALREESEALPEHVRPMLTALDRNARRLRALVEDVLQLSRLEADGTSLRLEREAVAPMVEAVVERHADRARRRGITVTAEVEPDLHALVNGDGFEHALSNLVDNALKYTADGGLVGIRAQGDGDRIRVDVVDAGPGIAAEHQERIFERFYRVDPGRSRDVGGTGLGLALVKHLCQRMGGEVAVESEPGRGSVFTLRVRAA